MPAYQDLVHKVQVASSSRLLRLTLAFLAVMLLGLAYNLCAFKNMSAPEAMDAAQLGRNLAEGKGYTTLFIRPFSLYLVKQASLKKSGAPEPGKPTDAARIQEAHPDTANPPVYPVVLAGLMKALPFDYAIPAQPKPFWNNEGGFWRYQPDFLIAMFNEVLFLAVVVAAFFLARRLFDATVAWTSAALLAGAELLWRFSVSGLSTMLLLLVFMGLVWCLVLLEAETRKPKQGLAAMFSLSAAAGLLVGAGGLTRYAFSWLIVPVLTFLILFCGSRRAVLCLLTLAACAAVMTPWILRNYHLSGAPFGTATYTVLEGTSFFPGDRLERSLEPDFSRVYLTPLWTKLLINARIVLQHDLPRLGGGWVTAFFLVGLLVGFRSPAIRRLRYFLLLSLGVLIAVQAIGRTQLSEESPEINSENLLVLLLPLAVIYGVSLFFLLLDQMNVPAPALRHLIVGVFGVAACLPMVFTFLPPRTSAVAYPPYYPPEIQQVAGMMKERELMMSDIPWAVAWYGRRQCVWLTLNAVPDPRDPNSRENFFAINNDEKPVNALYLTPQTLDGRFLSQWMDAGEWGWGSFVLNLLEQKEVPRAFPLAEMLGGLPPHAIFLADSKRWR